MKANELRIGNWFIEKDEIKQFDGDFYHLLDMKPIPLTEDWLIRFGFVHVNHFHAAKNYQLNGVDVWVYSDNDIAFGKLELKYVHQLENLYFALTGEELT